MSVPPEMSKINTNGIKTLPEDLHLGANVTGDAVQVSRYSQPFFAEILVPYFGFLLLPSFQFRVAQPSSGVAVLTTSHGNYGSFTGAILERTTLLPS